MNTKDWGPPTWVFEHKLSAYYPEFPDKETKNIYRCFYTKLKDVLPCKYCRESYTNFLTEDGLNIDYHLSNKTHFMYWFYKMHNRVNKKLRLQGLNNKPDPAFEEIYHRYLDQVTYWDMIRGMWEFLYTVVFNYPIKGEHACMQNFHDFFLMLLRILPNEYGYKTTLLQHFDIQELTVALGSRQALQKWICKLDAAVTSDINAKWPIPGARKAYTPQTAYNRFEKFRANCNQGTCSITKNNLTTSCSIVVPV